MQSWITFTNALVKLFWTHPPPGTPGGIIFWGGTPGSLSLCFCLTAPYINTIITLFSGAPPFFITQIFPLTPGLSRGEWGQINLTGALLCLNGIQTSVINYRQDQILHWIFIYLESLFCPPLDIMYWWDIPLFVMSVIIFCVIRSQNMTVSPWPHSSGSETQVPIINNMYHKGYIQMGNFYLSLLLLSRALVGSIFLHFTVPIAEIHKWNISVFVNVK